MTIRDIGATLTLAVFLAGGMGGLEIGGMSVEQAGEDDITLSDHEDERLEPFRRWMEGQQKPPPEKRGLVVLAVRLFDDPT